MTSKGDLDNICTQLDADDVRSLKILARCGSDALCIVPPTEPLIHFALAVPATDETARPVPRKGWKPTSLGMEVYDRIIEVETAAHRW